MILHLKGLSVPDTIQHALTDPPLSRIAYSKFPSHVYKKLTNLVHYRLRILDVRPEFISSCYLYCYIYVALRCTLSDNLSYPPSNWWKQTVNHIIVNGKVLEGPTYSHSITSSGYKATVENPTLVCLISILLYWYARLNKIRTVFHIYIVKCLHQCSSLAAKLQELIWKKKSLIISKQIYYY